jgi:hypothetical protein
LLNFPAAQKKQRPKAASKKTVKNSQRRRLPVRALIIVSIACLAIGVGLIFYFCHGNTGFSFGYPLSGTSLHVDITTTGAPALAGFLLTLLGAFLVILTWLIALIRPISRPAAPLHADDEPHRREEPFAE